MYVVISVSTVASSSVVVVRRSRDQNLRSILARSSANDSRMRRSYTSDAPDRKFYYHSMGNFAIFRLYGRKLKGNSTLKNISSETNIYDKWTYVLVIKLTMQIRYSRILTIKLLISRNVFLHGGRNSRPSSLFLYLCLFVDVDMVTKNGCLYVLSCIKTCVFSTVWQKFRNHSIHVSNPFWYVMLLLTVDLQQSMTHAWRHLWHRTIDVHKN